MSSVVRTATAGSPITRGATAIVPSARGRRHEIGSPRARPTCCRSATSTSPSHCPPRSPTGTRRRYTICCSVRHQRRCSRSRPSKHLGARIGFTAVLHSWGSAMTHHPHLHIIVPGGGISLDGTRWVPCRPGFSIAGAGALAPVPAALPGRARRRSCGAAGVLRRTRRPTQPVYLRRLSRAAEEQELVRLRQAALRRPRGGARLSRPLHPPCRHLEQPVDRSRRAGREVPLQGLPPRRADAVP